MQLLWLKQERDLEALKEKAQILRNSFVLFVLFCIVLGETCPAPLVSVHVPDWYLSLANHSESLAMYPVKLEFCLGYKLGCCNKEPPSITHVFISFSGISSKVDWLVVRAGRQLCSLRLYRHQDSIYL